jgi:nicotinamide mononucleotide transporter
MSIELIWHTFLDNIRQTRWQEWISTIMQVASVWYARKNNVLVYPTGIIGVLLASWVYYFLSQPPLYADAILNIYYFVMSVYGWYHWVQKKHDSYAYPISWCSSKERWNGILLFLASWAAIYFLLKKVTDSNTPVLDSLVSASAITAMWWMAKRKIENWLAWIFSNIVAIPLNFYKGFMLFTLMYVLFLVLAWMGYQSWKKMTQSKTV